MRALLLFMLASALPACAAVPALEENFVINAQYRNGVNKAFRDLGHGAVQYRSGEGGRFGLSLHGSMKNPETSEIYRMRITGEFKLVGRTITKISQKIEMNEEARRYEKLMAENLPFVWLARFQSLPASDTAEDVAYRYEGRDYHLRYVPLDDVTEATLSQDETHIGKFFLAGRSGQPPSGLTKAHMNGPDHVVVGLVVEPPTPPASRGE